MKKEIQKADDDNQRYSSKNRGFRGIETDLEINNNFYGTGGKGIYNLNEQNDWKNNTNVYHEQNKTINYFNYSSVTPKVGEHKRYESFGKINSRDYKNGYIEK